MTPEDRKALALTLAQNIHGPGKWHPGTDGALFRARVEYTDESKLSDYDYFGSLHETRKDTRPPGCNGAARIVSRYRHTRVWWQPPTDCPPDTLASLEKHVRGYYDNEWTYVVLVVERQSPPCGCCAERKTTNAALGGVESNTPETDLAETVADLLTELA